MSEAQVLEWMKSVDNRLTSFETEMRSRFKQLEDLVIEAVVSDKICLGNNQHVSKVKKVDLLSQNDIKYREDWEEIEGVVYKEFNKYNFSNMEEKEKLKPEPNQLNVFRWLCSHFLDVRDQVYKRVNSEIMCNTSYNTVVRLFEECKLYEKKYKSLVELLKAEANEIHKNYKDRSEFKNIMSECKKKYDTVQKI